MQKFKISIFSFIILVITPALISAQGKVISGTVMDSETGNPVPAATIALYKSEFNVSGSQPLGAAVANLEGEFILKNVKQENYYLIASAVGYKSYKKYQTFIELPGELLEIRLEKALISLGEVHVSTLRNDPEVKSTPFPVTIKNQEEIEASPEITTSGILSSEPGISLVRDGIWATSLNVRGLSEQRIITLVDGNRIETATDIAGALSLIDVNDIEKIEVIKGGGSSQYGSGAMGGILNVITKQSNYSSTPYIRGNISSGYHTVNNMFTEHAAVYTGSEKWHAKIAGSYRMAENTQTPEGELLNSGFEDMNLSISGAFKWDTQQELALSFQQYQANDVGIPGGSPFPPQASATYTDASRRMFSAEYAYYDITPVFTKLSAKYYNQYINREVELIPNPLATINPVGEHFTNGIQLQGIFDVAGNNRLIGGIDVWQRSVRTERTKTILMTDTLGQISDTLIRGEIPIPGSNFTSFGAYIQDETEIIPEKLSVTLAARVDIIDVYNDSVSDPAYIIRNGNRIDNPPSQRLTFEQQNVSDLSWSVDAGILWSITEDADLTVTLARSYRSPSLEERFKYIDLGSRVELGNPELKSEKGYFADVGFRIYKPKFHLQINGFVNALTDQVVGQPGYFVYAPLTAPQTRDSVPALINQNVDQSLLAGFDASTSIIIMKNTTLKATAAYVRGRDTKNNTNLPGIPPLNGSLGIGYNIPGIIRLHADARLYARQDKTAALEQETGGYALYNFSLESGNVDLLFAKAKLYAGVENIFDRAYRYHLSSTRGMLRLEPGRNIYVRLNLRF